MRQKPVSRTQSSNLDYHNPGTLMFDLYNSAITQKDLRAVNNWGLALSCRLLSLRSEVRSGYGIDLDASEANYHPGHRIHKKRSFVFCLLLSGFWFAVAPLTVWVARATTWLYPPFLVDTAHMLCLSYTALTFFLLQKPPYTLSLPCHRVFTIEANLWTLSLFLHWTPSYTSEWRGRDMEEWGRACI